MREDKSESENSKSEEEISNKKIQEPKKSQIRNPKIEIPSRKIQEPKKSQTRSYKNQKNLKSEIPKGSRDSSNLLEFFYWCLFGSCIFLFGISRLRFLVWDLLPRISNFNFRISPHTLNTLFHPTTPSGSLIGFSMSSAHMRSSMKNL